MGRKSVSNCPSPTGSTVENLNSENVTAGMYCYLMYIFIVKFLIIQ